MGAERRRPYNAKRTSGETACFAISPPRRSRVILRIVPKFPPRCKPTNVNFRVQKAALCSYACADPIKICGRGIFSCHFVV